MINWTVRIRNKAFWMAIIPALILLAQSIAAVFGYELELANLSDKLIAVINALFVVLALLGVVNDPTTSGISDSEQAMTYTEPKK